VKRIALVSSAAAPVLLIGGWLLAESRQPASFDPLKDAISDLAALDATDRGIMTTALVGVGVSHLITAFGLDEARLPGRIVLACGGLATVLVAVFPLPGDGGSSAAHTAAATAAFGALAVWPLVGAGGTGVPLLRGPVAYPAGAGLLVLVGWFGFTMVAGGPLGLAERVAAAAQAIWPLLVVTSERWSRAGRPEPPAGRADRASRRR
jgi:hypothetical membrane protein